LNWRTIVVLVLLFLAFILSTHRVPATEAKPLNPVRTVRAILLSPAPDPIERFAAEELQHYISQITGRPIPIVNHPGRDAFIAIGKNLATRELSIAPRYDGDDSFRIATYGGNLLLKGATPRGTLYAVYSLLERQGCWWFAPATPAIAGHHELVPYNPRLAFPVLDITEHPSMKYRKQEGDLGRRTHSAATWPAVIDWMAKQRSNVLALGLHAFEENRELLNRETAQRGLILEVGQHEVMNEFLPAERYFAAHPDWYGLIDGKRSLKAKGKSVVFETGNPQAVSTFEQNLIAYLKERPEIGIFQLWPPDAGFWSESPESQALGSPAERMALFVQHVTKSIRAAGLKTKVSFLAYSYYTEPPREMNFAPDVIVEFCPINRSYATTLDDPGSKVNVSYEQQLKEWVKQFPGEVSHYSYYAKYSWRSLPVVLPSQIARDIQHWQELGEVGTSIYCEPGDWLALEVNHLAFAKASWDSNSKTMVWYEAYLRARFGAAAIAMRSYFEHATRVSLDGLIPQSSKGDPQSCEGELTAARDAMNQAMKLADTVESKWMVNKLSWQVEYLEKAFALRTAQTNGDERAADEIRKSISSLIALHSNDGTALERGFGFKAAATEPD
jgi:hypothetical protein